MFSFFNLEIFLQFTDKFFIFFHSILIVFNVLGWIWEKTKRANFITLSITGFSWFAIGYWYGWGYCFCTDWHWQVREKLGYNDMPDSYIKFLIDYLFNVNINSNFVDMGTAIIFFIAYGCSFYVNFIFKKK